MCKLVIVLLLYLALVFVTYAIFDYLMPIEREDIGAFIVSGLLWPVFWIWMLVEALKWNKFKRR